MAKRTSGGRLTAAQRKKRREKSRGKDSLLRMPGNVAKYYRDNPGMLAEDIAVGIPGLSGIAIGRKAARGDSADAALSAAGLVPGIGAVGKGAKLAGVASKASKAAKTTKTPGTSTVKKTTKKAAAKKTTKKTTAKKTTILPKSPDRMESPAGSVVIKKSTKPKKKTLQLRKVPPNFKNLPRPKSVKPGAPKKPQFMIDKQRAADLKKLGDTGKRGRPQPKPKDLKTDAPGGSTSPGFTKKRPTKYKPEPTTARPGSPAKSGEARTTPMTTKEVEDFLAKQGFKRSETGLEGAYKRYKSLGLDKPKTRTKGVTKKTPAQREASEAQVERRKKAGGSQALKDAIRNPKLGGDVSIAKMSPAELKKALKNPRSSQSRLMKTLEKRAKRGNLREGEMQVLNRLRDNAPTASNQRQTEGLMRDGVRSVGQGQAEGGSKAGFVNPPRNVKASNPKWRGEGGKDAPKGPKGQSGTSKRGDKVTERSKEEDGVTRIKGTGGQARRVIAPSKDVAVARGGPRGRRVGGGATSGRKPIALGSGRRTPSKDVVRGEVVRGGRTSGGSKGRTARPVDLKTKPVGGGRGSSGRGPAGRGTAGRGAARAALGSSAAKGKQGKQGKKGKAGRKTAAVIGGLGATAILADRLGGLAEKSAPTESGKDKVTPRPKKPTSQLRDKYGRKIDRAEFNRREAYRKSLEGMTEAEKKKARKAEMKRREAYRARKGKGANIITRNLDLKEGVSSRKVNKEMKAAAGKGGKRQAAIDARKKYQRKKK